MSNKTRKHTWSGALVMSIAIIGALAAFLVLTSNPGATGAHGGDQDPHCSTVPAEQIGHDVAAEIAGTTNADDSAHTCDNPGTPDTGTPDTGTPDTGTPDTGTPDTGTPDTGTPDTGTPDTGTPDTGTSAGTKLESSSTSGGASVKLTLTIVDLPNNLNSGSWVEIYLEDDYQEPGSISRQDVVFIATNADGTGTRATNDGGTVTAAAVEIDDGGEIGNPDPIKTPTRTRWSSPPASPTWTPGTTALATPSRAKP